MLNINFEIDHQKILNLSLFSATDQIEGECKVKNISNNFLM